MLDHIPGRFLVKGIVKELLRRRGVNTQLTVGMHGTPNIPAADFLYSILPVPLRFLVMTRNPSDEGTHRLHQSTFRSGALTLAQQRPAHVPRPHFHNYHAGANAMPMRHFFPGRQDQPARRLLLTQAPVATHPNGCR
jgi:hypothetical protein